MELLKNVLDKAIRIIIGIPASFVILSTIFTFLLIIALFVIISFSLVSLIYIIYLSIALPLYTDTDVLNKADSIVINVKDKLKK